MLKLKHYKTDRKANTCQAEFCFTQSWARLLSGMPQLTVLLRGKFLNLMY